MQKCLVEINHGSISVKRLSLTSFKLETIFNKRIEYYTEENELLINRYIRRLNVILNEVDKQVLVDNWSGEEDILKLLQKITYVAENFLDKNILRKIKGWVSKIH